MYKTILKFFIPYFLFFIVNTFLFTQYVFSKDLDVSQRIAFSILLSFPLCIIYLLFLLYFHSLCLYGLINLIFVPSIKIWKYFFEVSEEKKCYSHIIDFKILVSYPGCSEELKKIYFSNLFKNNIYYDILRDKVDKNIFLNIYANLIAEDEELYKIVNFNQISKILIEWDRNESKKILEAEEAFIDLFMYFCWHKSIKFAISKFNYGVKLRSFPVYKKNWLEKFEDYLIEKNIYWFSHSEFVKEEKKERKSRERDYYRSFIRCGEIKKILLFLRDEEIKKNNKKYENDDFYYS